MPSKERDLIPHYNENLEYYSPVNPKNIEEISKALRIKYKNNTFLDLGCGTAWFGTHVQKNCGYYYGIDYAQKRVNLAREKWPSLAILCADYITLWDVLEHLENPLAVLQRYRPYGVILATVPINHEYKAHIQVFKDVEEELQPSEVTYLSFEHRPYALCRWMPPRSTL